ncbi:hypothetical protein BHU72_00860 [Desulfuribacillus stibiiarsenatis]|uniref:Methylated-DNA--protein-cysteine methyltransferase n=1 Tax=Desulfuribacillus stibiiarsenatis TaxID=1390249 RepID=A0A1E5L9V7_9FIRM|nr:methylated-DNA--[protein]-cysteine S-methyltransferase [Desulfuribacillus stibiiarsenatis]OEH86848.1 hypothetical protein BHU72_00860 [Desulfuribacillus stibiiarsenatis]
MEKLYIYKYDSPIGTLTVASDGHGITGLWTKNEPFIENDDTIQEVTAKELAIFEQTRRWLDAYFAGKDPGFIPPVKTEGTEFRESIWKILCEIPHGQVITYGDIAKRIALQTGKAKMSSQAVGGAVGSNPISIIIPCHRVVGRKGALTGYAGGIDVKARLLEIEGHDMCKFNNQHQKEG